MKKTGLITSLFIILSVNMIFCSKVLLRAEASGNITLEVKNPGKVNKEVKKIAAKYKAITKNFHIYTNNQTNKKSINITYKIPKADAPSFLNEIALLGEVTSQSYNDYKTHYNLAELKQKLKSFRQQLNKILSSPKPDPEIVKLFNQQIQSTERQIKRASGPSSEDATVRVNINEKGYSGRSGTAYKKEKSLIMNIIMVIIIAVVCFILGFVTSRFTAKKILPSKNKIVNKK